MDTGAAALRWDAHALRAALSDAWPGVALEVVPSCGSTNTALVERARAGDATPCVLVAEQQTAGRGRQGRAWASVPGGSLTFSIAVPYAPADWQGLSLVIGTVAAEALDPRPAATSGTPRIALKWPNDLWLAEGPGHGRKLAGILIETVASGPRRVAVIGIGLNVLGAALPQVAAGASTGAAAWQEIAPEATAPRALARLLPPLGAALRRFEREGYAPWAATYAARDLLRGCRVSTTQAGAEVGVAEGTDAHGALLVRTGDGAVHRIVGGEVSVRPASAPASEAA